MEQIFEEVQDEKEVEEEDEDEENLTEEEEKVQEVSPKTPSKWVQKNHPSDQIIGNKDAGVETIMAKQETIIGISIYSWGRVYCSSSMLYIGSLDETNSDKYIGWVWWDHSNLLW